MKKIFICINLIIFSISIRAQQSTQKKDTTSSNSKEQKVTVYGLIHNDVFFNSRRTLSLREGILDIYPLDISTPGVSSDMDLNKISQVGFSAIVSRIGVKFEGIKAFGAKASGTLEGDFFGVTNVSTVNSGNGTSNTAVNNTDGLLRLRHAYVLLDWKKTSLLFGQYWNPNFLPKCSPTTADFSVGIPINAFSFVPQIRFNYKLSNSWLITAMTFGYNIASFAPVVTVNGSVQTGVDAFKFSNTPSFALQFTYEKNNWYAGFGAETNVYRPKVTDTYDSVNNIWSSTGNNLVVKRFNTNLFTYNLLAFARLQTKPVTVKLLANYGQSFTQYIGLGGYASYRQSNTGAWKYIPDNLLNTWGEIIVTKNKIFQPALFVGYSQNLGLNKSIFTEDVYGTPAALTSNYISFAGRGITVSRTFDHLIRISPRLDVYSGKFKLMAEYEFNYMRFGNTNLSNMKIISEKAQFFNAINNRILFSVVYSF